MLVSIFDLCFFVFCIPLLLFVLALLGASSMAMWQFEHLTTISKHVDVAAVVAVVHALVFLLLCCVVLSL